MVSFIPIIWSYVVSKLKIPMDLPLWIIGGTLNRIEAEARNKFFTPVHPVSPIRKTKHSADMHVSQYVHVFKQLNNITHAIVLSKLHVDKWSVVLCKIHTYTQMCAYMLCDRWNDKFTREFPKNSMQEQPIGIMSMHAYASTFLCLIPSRNSPIVVIQNRVLSSGASVQVSQINFSFSGYAYEPSKLKKQWILPPLLLWRDLPNHKILSSLVTWCEQSDRRSP